MPDPILYTILHPYAFHQFVLKILSGNEVGIMESRRIWWDKTKRPTAETALLAR